MKLKPIYFLTIVLAVVLAVGLPLLAGNGGEPSADASEPVISAPAPEASQPATEAVTQAPTEPDPKLFTLSFVGDCTLGCSDENRPWELGFELSVGEDYDFPLANVRYLFENDDFTIANLEGPLTEGGEKMEKEFVFRGDPAYTAILTGSSVEAVTTSNNHFYDYGETGMRSTNAALDAAGIAHAWRDYFLYTTDSGLTVGVYCDDFSFEKAHMESSFAAMRAEGAEVIVCAFHWGQERDYTPNDDQILWAHIAIDLGADIVYGHHPHVLQPIEHYGDGVIFYSLGNFCYGGNTWPVDFDTAVIQQQLIRQPDGSITLGDTIAVPCTVSSATDRNNYQPTPMEPGSGAYERVMRKLEGTYQ